MRATSASAKNLSQSGLTSSPAEGLSVLLHTTSYAVSPYISLVLTIFMYNLNPKYMKSEEKKKSVHLQDYTEVYLLGECAWETWMCYKLSKVIMPLP